MENWVEIIYGYLSRRDLLCVCNQDFLLCQKIAGVMLISMLTVVKFFSGAVISKFFSEGMFSYRRFSLLQSEHPLFCIFPDYFSKYLLLKLKLFRHNTDYNKNLLRNSPKIAKKVCIHFYENILSEINWPLI